jgi:pimeloyl-ACP methyl ester carboxylesterase
VQEFGRSCLERSGPLLEHISTEETVRDLDLLRELVGDTKINYFGSSYGTRIGSLYAELYPDRVGRMVLDGSVDISDKPPITQTEGFERALDHFATWCANESCRLGDSRDEVLLAVRSFLERLDQTPMPLGNGRVLTQQLGVEGVIYSMYGGARTWRPLAGALAAAIVDAKPAALMVLADLSNRRLADGSYGQLNYSFQSVRCLDSQDNSVREAQERYTEVSADAPVLGAVAGPDLVCALWPVPSAPKQPTIDGEGAPPIVVIGTTGDPATPYEYAENMADQLASGVLVAFNGEGHLAYGQSPCIDRIVASYLMADQVPADRTTC